MSDGVPFGFDTYGTKTGGCVVGETYKDHATGYEYMFIQAHTDFQNDVGANGEIACQVSATQRGIITNKGSTVGLDTTYPMAVGIITSAIPESTSAITYYGWALKRGYAATLLNDGTDITVGWQLYPTAVSPCSCKGIVGTTTSDNGVIQSIFGRAATTVTGTNCTAYVNFKDI